MLIRSSYFQNFGFVPIAVLLSLLSVQVSYSQVYFGNTTSIGSIYLKHVNPQDCIESQIQNIASSIRGPASRERLPNIVDNNLTSFWASSDLGTRLKLDLGTEKQLCYIEIAWQGGSTHSYNYTVYLSNDYSYQKVGEQSSSGKSEYPEAFNLNYQKGRYIDVITNGSNTGNRTTISEIKIYSLKE